MTNMKLLLAAFVVATASTAEAVNSGKNQYTVTMWGPKEVPGDFGAFGPKGDDTTDVGTCGGTGHDYILSSKSDTVTGDSTGMCSDMTKVGTEEKAQMSLQCVCSGNTATYGPPWVPKRVADWSGKLYDGVTGIKQCSKKDPKEPWSHVEFRIWPGNKPNGAVKHQAGATCTKDWEGDRGATDGMQNWVVYLTKDQWIKYYNGECVTGIELHGWKGYKIAESSSGVKAGKNELPDFGTIKSTISMKAKKAKDVNIIGCGMTSASSQAAAATSYTGVAVVELSAPAKAPGSVAGYTLHSDKECTGVKAYPNAGASTPFETNAYAFGKYSGGNVTLKDCVNRCETMGGCFGFSYASGVNKDFECTAFKGPTKMTECKDSSVAGYKTSNTGANLYIRDGGLVAATGFAEQKAALKEWVGQGPAAGVVGFKALAGLDCSGGDKGTLITAQSGGTVAACAAACKTQADCDGIVYTWDKDSTKLNECKAKSFAAAAAGACRPKASKGQTFYLFLGEHEKKTQGLNAGSVATASLLALAVAAAAAIKML